MNKEQKIERTIKRRKPEYLGHALRGIRYKLLRLLMDATLKEKRSIGNRISWLMNLSEWFGMRASQLFRTAANKARIAIMISNLLQEKEPHENEQLSLLGMK